jgi:alanine-glyoxylate transaminase / serine-glyoxylate transaminase / serine-pyruvate transaminase
MAVFVPPGFDSRDVVDTAFQQFHLALAPGLSALAGKVFRIGHIGDLNEHLSISKSREVVHAAM